MLALRERRAVLKIKLQYIREKHCRRRCPEMNEKMWQNEEQNTCAVYVTGRSVRYRGLGHNAPRAGQIFIASARLPSVSVPPIRQSFALEI